MQSRLSRRATLRTLATGTLLTVAGVGLSGSSVAATAAGEATQDGFDAGNTGSFETGSVTAPLVRSWDRTVSTVDAMPLVVEDLVLVYGLDRTGTRVEALDRETGVERWSFDTEEPAVSSVITADRDRAYFGTVLDPTITAVSLADGRIDWQTTVETEAGGFRGPPRRSGGQLYFRTRSGAIAEVDPTDGDASVIADEEYTRFTVEDGTVYASRGKPGAETTGIDVVDPNHGGSVTHETDGRPRRPTVSDGTLYVGTSENEGVSLDAEDGERHWRTTVPDWVVTVTQTESVILGVSDEYVTAFDSSTGESEWQVDAGASRPVVADNVVYVGRRGGIDGYNLATGNDVFSYRDSGITGHVTYVVPLEEELYAASLRGEVQKFVEGSFRMGALNTQQ